MTYHFSQRKSRMFKARFRRILTIAVLCIFCIAALPVSAQSSLPDVPEDAWYAEAVRFVMDHDVMHGTGDGFHPGDMTKREEFAQIMFNLFATDEEKQYAQALCYENVFSDVDMDRWYGPAVTWANAKGYVSGYGDGNFGINDLITRQQICTILYRVTEGEKALMGDLKSFCDGDTVSAYARDPMRWVCGLKIIQGDADRNLRPLDSAKRSEIAKIMMIYCRSVLNIGNPAYIIRKVDCSSKDDEGNDIVAQYYDLIELTSSAPERQKINQALIKFGQKQMLSPEEADSYTQIAQKTGTTFFNNCHSSVEYFFENVISILHHTDWFMGGVSSHIPTGHTFSLKTGELMTAAELVDMEKNELDTLIRKTVRDYMQERQIIYEECEIEALDADTVDFYVLDGKIIILIPEYAIASGAAGSMEIPTEISITQ